MFKLRIETKNAAFDDTNLEIVRILQETIERLKQGSREGKLFDYNGNNIGSYKLTKR